MKTLAIILLLTFAGHALAQVTYGPVRPLSPEIMNPQNGHIYRLLSQGNWTDSEAVAISLGGHLATIRNQAENSWVSAIFGGYGGQGHDLWIGLNYVKKRNAFVWSSGERVKYTNWTTGAPMSYPGYPIYGAIMGYGITSYWNSWGDTGTDFLNRPFNGVVEIIPKGFFLR